LGSKSEFNQSDAATVLDMLIGLVYLLLSSFNPLMDVLLRSFNIRKFSRITFHDGDVRLKIRRELFAGI